MMKGNVPKDETVQRQRLYDRRNQGRQMYRDAEKLLAQWNMGGDSTIGVETFADYLVKCERPDLVPLIGTRNPWG